jgi:hypothetical protein
MGAIKNHKQPRRFLIGLLLFVCLHLAPLSRATKTNRAEAEPELRYRLIVIEPSVCHREGITLELELQNTRNHKISIDPRVMLYMIDIRRDLSAMVPTSDLMGPKVRPDQTVDLAPNQSYRKTIKYPLQDNFFLTAGVYTIQVTYGQFTDPYPALPDLYAGAVKSNKVLFEIKDCDANGR